MNNGNYDRKGNHSRLKSWFPTSDNSQRMQNEKANCFDNNPVYSNCGAVLKLLQQDGQCIGRKRGTIKIPIKTENQTAC